MQLCIHAMPTETSARVCDSTGRVNAFLPQPPHSRRGGPQVAWLSWGWEGGLHCGKRQVKLSSPSHSRGIFHVYTKGPLWQYRDWTLKEQKLYHEKISNIFLSNEDTIYTGLPGTTPQLQPLPAHGQSCVISTLTISVFPKGLDIIITK